MHPRDLVAIRLAALTYEEGWFEGNAERIGRCLHPKLAKRTIKRDADTGERYFIHLTKEDLVRHTSEGGGTDVPRDKIYYKVDVLDVFDDVAVVRAESYPHMLTNALLTYMSFPSRSLNAIAFSE